MLLFISSLYSVSSPDYGSEWRWPPGPDHVKPFFHFHHHNQPNVSHIPFTSYNGLFQALVRAHGPTASGSPPFTIHCARVGPHEPYLFFPRLWRTLSRQLRGLENQLTVESTQPSANFRESSYPQVAFSPLFAQLTSPCLDLHTTFSPQCLLPSASMWMIYLPLTSVPLSARHKSAVTCKLDQSTLAVIPQSICDHYHDTSLVLIPAWRPQSRCWSLLLK